MNSQGDIGGEGRFPDSRGSSPVRRLPVGNDKVRALSDAEQDEVLRRAVDRARRIADEQPEPFRSLAFTTLLDHLLKRDVRSDAGSKVLAKPQAGPPSTDMQIAEFLAQRRLDSHPDRVVAIAYYHFHHADGQGITTKDLVDAYARCRARRPQNFPDVIASCMRKGYLVDGARRDGMKTWVITGTGESHVEQDM